MRLTLSRFGLRTFIPPLIGAFFVTWFVFIMQHLWLYIDDFIGKGLETQTILKYIGLYSLVLVPASLPLGILFAAIMCFGNIGESSELVAIKSSGISVFKFSKPIFIFVFFLSIASFFFNDIIIPRAQIKAYKMYHDIYNKKPAINIKQGIFYKEIPNHTIYVSKKDADNSTIHHIKIYDNSEFGNPKIILAEKGRMRVTPNNLYLVFELENGWRYEEKRNEKDKNQEQIRLGFKKWTKVFNLSDFKMKETEESYFKNMRAAMTLKQINREIDTAKRNNQNIFRELQSSVEKHLGAVILSGEEQTEPHNKPPKKWKSTLPGDTEKKNEIIYPADSLLVNVKGNTSNRSYFDRLPESRKNGILNAAEVSARGIKNTLEINKQNAHIQQMNLAEFLVEYHKRFTIPFACIVLFVIGTSLGSIIRKGGLGMPFIWAVGFFVIYYVLNTIGERISRELVVPVWLGMWMPAFFLSLLAVFLLIKANNDSPLMNKEWYFRLFKSIKSKLTNHLETNNK